MSKFAKTGSAMSTALSNGLREYAVKRWPTMNHEWRKAKIASMLGMKVRRVRSYWDGEEKLSARVDEVEAINALMNQPQSKLEEANQDAFAELQARIARLEAILLPQETSGDYPAMAGLGAVNYGRRRTDVPDATRPLRRSTDWPASTETEG